MCIICIIAHHEREREVPNYGRDPLDLRALHGSSRGFFYALARLSRAIDTKWDK